MKKCPKCGRIEQQVKAGFNASGTQRCRCKICGIRYTLEPKSHAYSEEIKEAAIKAYYSGVIGRGVGHLFHMNKENIYNWIKKTNNVVETCLTYLQSVQTRILQKIDETMRKLTAWKMKSEIKNS